MAEMAITAETRGAGSPASRMARTVWLTPTLVVLLVVIFVGLGASPPALVYERQATLSGEWYRLISGHLVHLDWSHLATNAGAFAALGWLFEKADFGGPVRLAALLVCSAFAVSATLVLAYPATSLYCGFSACLNALYMATALGLWRQTRDATWIALALLAPMKVGWEWMFGSLVSSGLAWPPHSGAHMAGLAVGFTWFAARPLKNRINSTIFGMPACRLWR